MSLGLYRTQVIDSLNWIEAELQQGEIIKIRDFPAELKVFRVVLQRTDYIVTNEIAQDNVEVVQLELESRAISP